MKKILLHIKHILEFSLSGKLIKKIRNWPEFYLAYLGIYWFDELEIKFRTGLKITIRTKGSDKWTIHEVFLRDDYHVSSLPKGVGDIIDIGSNVGAFSLLASGWKPSHRIFAFEPEPNNYQYLQENIKHNGLQQKIHCHNLAVFGKERKQTLFLDPDNYGGHSMSQGLSMENQRVEVECLSLKEIFIQENISYCFLLKMDVEGAEYNILYNTPQDIFHKIKHIKMEYHDMPDDKTNTGKALAGFLRDKEFNVEIRPLPLNSCGYLHCKNKAL